MLKTEMVKGVVGRGGGRRRREEGGGGKRGEGREREGKGGGGGVTALRASILYKKYSTQHSTLHVHVLTAKVKAFRAISLPATVSRSATTHTLSCLVTNSPAPERERER